jgi:pilus assembly protein CpaF
MGIFEDSIDVFLTPIAEYLRDDSVSEILMNGPEEIWIERKGKLVRTEARFHGESALQAAMRNIAQSVGRKIDAENPTLDARLPDGSRIHVVIPPAARAGTTVAIRKFSKAEEVTLEKLVGFGSISADAAKFLHICIQLGKNMIVSGGTGSGKTTLLNTLGRLIPSHERLLIVEDASELQVKAEHVVCFETISGNFEKVGALSIRDLLKSAMRLRPDRIIVGEVRGPEAMDLISVMNTGHGGSMGTTHANSPIDALVRLECLAMMSETPLPINALRRQISSAVHIVIQAKRYSDGSRKISHVSQTLGVDEHGNYKCQDLFRFVQKGKAADGRVIGAMEACGVLPTFMPEIEVNGYVYPRMKFARPAAPVSPGAAPAPASATGNASTTVSTSAAKPAASEKSGTGASGTGQGSAA